MNNTLYENMEVTVMSFLSSTIENAIYPYALEVEGSFKLNKLREKLKKTLQDTVILIRAFGYSNNEKRMRDISLLCARRMCSQINTEVFSLFRRETGGEFFMIDFYAFSDRIAALLCKEFTSLEERTKNL